MKYSILFSIFGFLFMALPVVADDLPDDGYDYEGAVAQYSADLAAESKRTIEEWNATASYWLEFKAGPYIKDGAVMGANVIMLRRVLNDKSDQPGRVIEQSVSTWFSPDNPGTYMSLGQLRQKYPQFEGRRGKDKEDGNNSFEEAFTREIKSLESEIETLNLLKGLARDEYMASFNTTPEGKKPVMKGEDYTGEEVSLVSTINVSAALESEERRKRENSLLRRISDIDQRTARLAALQGAASSSKAELQRLAALNPKEIARQREELTQQALYYEEQYAKTAEKLMKANREKTAAILELGTNAALNGIGNSRDAKALMTNPDAATTVDKMRKAGDTYDAIVQEREFFLKTYKEYQFKAEFYKLAEQIAARVK
jgi:hypothetical protein